MCQIFIMSSVSLVPEFCKLLPINQLATTRHIPLHKAENIEEFIQPVSVKPDPVLISAYITNTKGDTDFLCSVHPYHSTFPVTHITTLESLN